MLRVGGTRNGAGLWPTAVPAPQDNTSDTADWTVAVASNPTSMEKFLRFGFYPLTETTIQVGGGWVTGAPEPPGLNGGGAAPRTGGPVVVMSWPVE